MYDLSNINHLGYNYITTFIFSNKFCVYHSIVIGNTRVYLN